MHQNIDIYNFLVFPIFSGKFGDKFLMCIDLQGSFWFLEAPMQDVWPNVGSQLNKDMKTRFTGFPYKD